MASVCLFVTDRNTNARQLMHRELLRDGYKAFPVCTVQELKQKLRNLSCDKTVLILDPEWTEDRLDDCLESIRRMCRMTRVIIHFRSNDGPKLPDWTRRIVHKAENVQELRQILLQPSCEHE